MFFIIIGSSCNQNTAPVEIPKILEDFKNNPGKSILPDFSYAGYAYGEVQQSEPFNKTVYNVVDFGAVPNDGREDTEAIQKAIDSMGINGGGILEFPEGRFLVNMDSTRLGNIQINYSNIMIRGAGQDSLGTIIYSGRSTHTYNEKSSWLSQFVFHTGLNLFGTDRFYTVEEEPLYSILTEDLKKGDDILHLEKTEGLKAGSFIMIAMKNTTEDGDLMKELMNPLEFEGFQTSYLNAGKIEAPSFQWLVEIDEVLDAKSIRIKQTSRRDILRQYKAWVVQVPMLRNVGIENLRFECAYKGGYKHHLNREHDYGWGAVCLHRVAHGWIKNLTIHNYTQTTHIVNSRNVSIKDITITGWDGHYGPKLYNSSDNLISNINVLAPRTHGPGIEGASFGNVFKDIYLKYPQPIDLHGLAEPRLCPPMYNLFENISMVTKVAGGGAPQNIPHAGEYNTFWNIEMEGFKDGEHNEVFYSWIWRNPEKFKNELHIDCHKQYLRSIVVGVYNSEHLLTIEHDSSNRYNEWIYVEGLNKKQMPISLYKEQLKNRLNQKQ
jgi:hypothetical protein